MFAMPRKKKVTFTKTKRGRNGDGKGGCGHGRGGWLGRVVDLEVREPKCTNNIGGVSQPSFECKTERPQKSDNESTSFGLCKSSNIPSMCSTEEVLSPEHEIKFEEIELPNEESLLDIGPDFHSLIPEVQAKISCYLPQHWVSICDGVGVSVLLLSRDVEMTTQRRVFVSYFGNVTVSAHRKKISEDITLNILSVNQTVPLSENNVGDFAKFVISVVDEIRRLEVCVGCNHEEYESLWAGCRFGTVDTNPFGETRYSKTFRSNDCQLLILSSKWRCIKCYHLSEILKRKLKVHSSLPKVHTPNIHLTETEKIYKLCTIQNKLEVSRRLVCRLQSKIESLRNSTPSACTCADNG